MDNLNIFIGAYKPFKQVVKNDSYKIIVGKHDIENNTSLTMYKCSITEELDDRFYSEIYMLKCLVDKIELAEYDGFCHYRKYFSFLDNIPDMDEIFKEYDVICANKLMLRNSVREQYGKCHYNKDLELVENIIKEKFPEYYESFETVMNRKWMYPYNMVIMKRDDFKGLINFTYSVLKEFTNIIGTDIEKRINDNKQCYLKRYSPNNTVEYQYRIGGYIAERLTNVYIQKKFSKIKEYQVKITESKYKKA